MAPRKFNDEQVSRIRNTNVSLTKLAHEYGATKVAVWSCRHGYTYKPKLDNKPSRGRIHELLMFDGEYIRWRVARGRARVGDIAGCLPKNSTSHRVMIDKTYCTWAWVKEQLTS